MDEENKKDENTTPEDKLEQIKKERDEYLDGWKRAKADLMNYKKEDAVRAENLMRYANEDMMYELIAVLDNFDMSLAVMEKQGNAEKGVYMMRAQLYDILRCRGLERIKVDIGKPLDPAVAEAVAEIDVPAGGESPPGAVIEEIEAGYKLFDKVIRPARVKVSK